MIYDCFTFFNELELLEIRLNYLNEIVDKFVLVEMGKTFSNNEKPFYFEENKHRFEKFLDKIIHIKVTDYPEDDNLNSLYYWYLENHQRDCIMRGLTDAKPDDIIMISDLDEIPSISAIKSYSNVGIYSFRQIMSYYYLNCVCVNDPYWSKAKICTYKDLVDPKESVLTIRLSGNFKIINNSIANAKRGLPSYARHVMCGNIPNGGWHFSCIGGAERIAYKTKSFAHQEWNKEEFVNIENIKMHMKDGTDIYNRDYSYKPVPLDNTYPEYILKNIEKYKDLICVL